MSIKEEYQFALDSQMACNSSGLIKHLAGALDHIWEEARAKGQGTDYVNKHPIVVLYLEQLCHLSGVTLSHPAYDMSYNICKEEAEGE